MKRVSAILDVSAMTISADEIRPAVELIFLRASPPVSFRMGAIVPISEDRLVVEIASDASKGLLQELLKKIETRVGISVEQIGWGWIGSGGFIPPIGEELAGHLRQDPLLSQEGQSEPERIYRDGRGQMISLILTSFSLFILIGFYIAIAIAPEIRDFLRSFDSLVWVVILMVTVFGISLGVPTFPWSFITYLRSTPENLQVKRWLRRSIKKLDWKEIIGLHLREGVCIVETHARPFRFLTQEKLGMVDQLVLVKTIIERSQLNFVTGNIPDLRYRRFDAP